MILVMETACEDNWDQEKSERLSFILSDIQLIHLQSEYADACSHLNENMHTDTLRTKLIKVLTSQFHMEVTTSESAVNSAMLKLENALINNQLLLVMPFSIY